jgi:hypothetical protein
MATAVSTTARSDAAGGRLVRGVAGSGTARALLGAVILGAAVAGYFVTGSEAASHAAMQSGADLTRLLRAMALLKALMAAIAAGTVLWRLGTAVTLPWLAGYAVACAAMSAGPGLIWGMAQVGLGATLLHGGLLATVVLLWRDPVVGQRLAAIVASRRAGLG